MSDYDRAGDRHAQRGPTVAKPDILEPIPTTGTPQAVGAAFGAINAEVTREHVADFLRACSSHGLDEAAAIGKSQRGLDIIRTLAPYWEHEMVALAEAADINPEVYIAFAIGKYRELFWGQPECTSYGAAGSYVPFEGTSFHKSRDNVSRLQCCFTRRLDCRVCGPYAWCGTGDTSDATTCMFVNERGLAGSADTGARTGDFYGDGLMNTFSLMYVAETCADCDQALATLQEWSDNRFYAGGKIKTNYMFSDAAGTVLRVVQDNVGLETQSTTDGIIVNCERKHLESGLKRMAGHLDAWALTEASRIKSVSMPSTISSLSVDCRPEAPEYLTCAWFALGMPVRSPYVPVFIASTTTPRALLDGSLYQRSMPSRVRIGQIRQMEAGFRRRVDECLEQVRDLIAAGDTDAVSACTEQCTNDCVKTVFDTMTGDV